ncbi:cytochrome P450 [Suillus subaureus]|uniref:Cytochrome P450 n=1 Tax=Suillus subaureus TaxID=48587 RepID=A0A9P7EBF3_9AGAM|nr:cytochrome P450 [Suillus subaureus]KAG1816399.1 cytochrome P450 [Suillus subaureus]
MSSLRSFLAFILPQLPDLRIPDNMQLLLSAAACLGVIGVITRTYCFKSESNLPLPPSPPTWRLCGHFLPHRNSFLIVAGWIDEYGSVITIRSRFEKIVHIGRYKAAVDIMENQGKLVADRPPNVAAEISNGGMGIALVPFGDRLRRMRSYAATIIMKIAYGKNTPTSATDPEVVGVNQLIRMTRSSKILRPGAYLVNSIPWLKYLPWYGRDLRQRFERNKKLYTGNLNRVKEQMHNNEDIGFSFTKYMLENSHVYGLTEIEIAFLAGTFLRSGSQTTSSTMCTVFMAAACFPEEQAKVQAELDAVIGRHRAPTFSDQKSLPRLQAFISEALRWRPPIPDALAHRTIKDKNYCIPAGTTVYGNVWSISRDRDVFPEPDAFKPQRWIDGQGSLRDDIKLFVFGFGRRVCPGQHVANRSVFITALLILWAFKLTLDPTKPLEDMGFMGGSMPDIRPCTFEFEKRIPETELRRMMQDYPEVA